DCLAAQQIAAVRIAQRQRLATRAIAGEEPALEVDAPDVIGLLASRKRRARRRAAAPQPPGDWQALAVGQSPERARCGPGNLRRFAFKPSTYFHRAPGRMCLAHVDAALGDRTADRVRMLMRRTGSVDKADRAVRLITRQPFVSGPPAHAELPANVG